MIKILKYTGLICIVLCCFSCKNDKKPSQKSDLSFYHWQTDFDANEELLKQSSTEKLYLRFFDLYYNTDKGEALPKGTVQISKNDIIPVKEIIPVIYITNEVFSKVTGGEAIAELADNTLQKINRIRENALNDSIIIKEIQFDCDWTQTTGTLYASFLKKIKDNPLFEEITGNQGLLSATIRLHQVKYFEKTGVPAVDKAVIMFYNMGDLGDINEENSILNLEKTKPYLNRLNQYPLKFDVAIPYFAWGALYQNKKFVGIIHNIDPKVLATYFTKIDHHKYKAKEEIYIDNQFIYEGNIIRIEEITLKNLKTLRSLINKHYNKPYNVILYRLNSKKLNPKTLHEIISIFSNQLN